MARAKSVDLKQRVKTIGLCKTRDWTPEHIRTSSDDIRHHVLTTNDVKQQRLEWHFESKVWIP
jgi:hypothetical protein